LGTTNTATINAAAPSTGRVYTIKDPGADANFAMTTSAGPTLFTGPTAAHTYTLPNADATLVTTTTLNNNTLAGSLTSLNVNSGGITGAGAIAGATSLTLSGAISGGTTYSGSGNINTTGGVLQTNSITRIDNAGALSNITGLS